MTKAEVALWALNRMKLLVIEDHVAMRSLLAEHLQRVGFLVDCAVSGCEAEALLNLSNYDAMLLDLGLPDMDGMSLLQRRQLTPNADLPCLILSARDALSSRVDGLNAGADDYILKPFDMTELEARLRAVLRRPRECTRNYLQAGNVRFEPLERCLRVADHTVQLARRESILLESLLLAMPRVVIKDHLEECLYSLDEPVTPNAIEALVSRLRRKLSQLQVSGYIETVRGLGYRWVVSDV